MRFNHTVTVVGKGTYGPFKDDAGNVKVGSEIPYLVVADGHGDPEKASCSQDFEGDVDDVPMMTPVVVSLELYRGDGKLKLRVHGVENGAGR